MKHTKQNMKTGDTRVNALINLYEFNRRLD